MQTMLIPGKRKMERIAHNGLIQESPVTTKHITHTNHTYGPDFRGLKGKGTKRKIPSISVDITKILPSITSLYQNVTAGGDIFFVNKVTLFRAIRLNIRYGYGERLLNRHIPTFLKSIKHMRSHSDLSGFLLCEIKLNPEFEPLPHGLERINFLLNKMGQGDHVREAKQFLRTTKDSFCAGFVGTPFNNLLIALNIDLVLVGIFLNNYVTAESGVSRSISPKGTITGR